MGNRLKPQLEGSDLVENDPGLVEVIGGVPRCGVRWALTEEEHGQVRSGYRCLQCMGVQEEPFPEVCEEPFCDFEIRKYQLARYEREYEGERWYGPTPDSVFDEERERERWLRRKGVWLPEGGV